MEWKISSHKETLPKLNVAKNSKQNWRREKQQKKDKVSHKKRRKKELQRKKKS